LLQLHDAILASPSFGGLAFERGDPLAFCADLRKIKTQNGIAPGVGVHGRHVGVDGLEARLASGEKAVALVEEAFSRVSIERGEQAHADAKLIFRGGFFFGKTSKPLE
jgi:hypothetical protein